MAKLHELLATETSLKGQSQKAMTDISNTFSSKRHLFEEKLVTFQSNVEGEPVRVEGQSSLQSTVGTELDWLSGFLNKSLDAGYAISEANTMARADVVLEDGSVILKAIPATALLDLEKRLSEIQAVAKQIPTLDPAKGFKVDPSRPGKVYVANEVSKTRTKKITKPLTMYEATKEHPAQVQLVSEDVPVGTIVEREWSGLITPAEKSSILDRIEQLKRAVKQARSRANEQSVNGIAKIGSTITGFIFGRGV